MEKESIKIYLLGNGFDLNYNLPTKYINFLNVVSFLKDNYDEKTMKTVGEVLGNRYLAEKDGMILTTYDKYKDVYDKSFLNVDVIKKLIKKANENIWFNYFEECKNKDFGWIDFEKEIHKVLESFHVVFELNINARGNVKIPANRKDVKFVMDYFDYFLGKRIYHGLLQMMITLFNHENNYFRFIKKEYIKEEPFGSGNFLVNKEAILKKLSDELREFDEMLKVYLQVFVEEPFEKNKRLKKLPDFISIPDYVVTLNYTKIFEIIISNYDSLIEITVPVFHLHGKTNGNIVLGVNADKYDELESLEESFVFFKKYFQRIIYRTDLDYLAWLQKINNKDYDNRKKTLSIIGHSLDVTDKDVIKELFDISNEIIIYYHDQEAIERYTRNLVSIFGKSVFDAFRSEKKLHFEKQ